MGKKVMGIPLWALVAAGGWVWYTKSKGLTLLGAPALAAPASPLTPNAPPASALPAGMTTAQLNTALNAAP